MLNELFALVFTLRSLEGIPKLELLFIRGKSDNMEKSGTMLHVVLEEEFMLHKPVSCFRNNTNVLKLSKIVKQQVICQRLLILCTELADPEDAKNRDASTWSSIVHICDFTCIVFLNVLCGKEHFCYHPLTAFFTVRRKKEKEVAV